MAAGRADEALRMESASGEVAPQARDEEARRYHGGLGREGAWVRVKIGKQYYEIGKVLGAPPLYKLSAWRPLYQPLTCHCCKGGFFVGPFIIAKER